MSNIDKIWMKFFYIADRYWGCHQIPDRSFFIKGYQLPICARCTGILLGYILGLSILLLSLKINILTSIFLMVFLIIDGTLQYFTKYNSNNIKRLITGLAFGLGFFMLINYILGSFKFVN